MEQLVCNIIICPIPSNIKCKKYVLAKNKMGEISIKWLENIRCQTFILSHVLLITILKTNFDNVPESTKFKISDKTHHSLTGLLAMNSCSPTNSSSALDHLATGGARSVWSWVHCSTMHWRLCVFVWETKIFKRS